MNTKSFKITQLTVSKHNVRHGIQPAPETIHALADNIIAINKNGRLIHPITVQEVNGKGEVVAGKTRMLALQYLIEDGRLPADATTDCFLVESDAEAVLVSQSENMQREQMHPTAEFAGFQKLIEEGHSIEAIALAFGVTNRYVEGRLRLASVAPALLEGFKTNNHPNLEQVMALALTEDHGRQLAVWESRRHAQWQCTPKNLREALAGDGTIDANADRRIKIVSVAEYEAAGGRVQASLLTDHAFLLDAELFEQLVADKLNAIAADVQAEGWSWVEVFQDNAYQALQKFGTTQPTARTPTEDEKAELDRLQAAMDKAAEIYHDLDDDDDEEEEAGRRMEEAEQALAAYQEQFYEYSSEQKSFGGAAVYLNSDGALEVGRGLVRREDRRALDEAAREGRLAAGVAGGRTTGDAGRPAETMSAALRDDLRGLRVIAVQNVMAKNVRVAKVTMALWAVSQLQDAFGYNELPIDLGISGHGGMRGRLHMMGPAVKDAEKARDTEFAKVVAKLPEDNAKCWDALVKMTDEQLDAIIAYSVALAMNPDDGHDGVTAKILDALDFDMAEHFQATPETYTARVPKALVIEALAEVDQAKDAGSLQAMKKGPLAEVAAERLAGTGWVPELIRTPARKPKAKAEPKAAAKKPAAKKAAAKKAAPAKKAPAKK